MNAHYASRRRSPLAYVVYPLALIALLLIVAVVFTVINGELRIPLLSSKPLFAFASEEKQQPAVPEGHRLVFANPRALPAYTKLVRDHLFKTPTEMHTIAVSEGTIEAANLFTADADGLRRILGRVLKRDKAAGFVFSERDFLPEGSRAGVSAGIPPGKRGIWVEAEKVLGLADLRRGDRFDLVAADVLETKSVTRPDLGKLVPDAMSRQIKTAMNAAASGSAAKRVRTWVVADNATVVTPMRIRDVPTQSASLLKGTSTQTRPVQEIFLAMAPQEIAKLTQALAMEVEVRCAPRSGQPGDENDNHIEAIEPPDPDEPIRKMMAELFGSNETDGGGRIRMVEVIRGGGKRETVPMQRNAALRK